jgi:hypothetical protein
VESAGVVNLVDEAGKVGCDVLEGFVCHQIHGLDLQCLHEALPSGAHSNTERRLTIVVKSAARFCDADDVTIFELEGQDLRAAAHWGAIPQDLGVRFPCSRGHVAGRAVLERRPFHVIDLQAEAEEFPEGSAFAKRLGHRTTASVPLLREGVTVGAITLRRAEVNPFTLMSRVKLKSRHSPSSPQVR